MNFVLGNSILIPIKEYSIENNEAIFIHQIKVKKTSDEKFAISEFPTETCSL